MKQEVPYIHPWKMAKIAAYVMLVFILAIFALFLIIHLLGMGGSSFAGEMYSGVATIFMLGIPVLYTAFTFIGTAIACYLYNFLASKIGGIQFEIRTPAES